MTIARLSFYCETRGYWNGAKNSLSFSYVSQNICEKICCFTYTVAKQNTTYSLIKLISKNKWLTINNFNDIYISHNNCLGHMLIT